MHAFVSFAALHIILSQEYLTKTYVSVYTLEVEDLS
jgi:hypothetical protein